MTGRADSPLDPRHVLLGHVATLAAIAAVEAAEGPPRRSSKRTRRRPTARPTLGASTRLCEHGIALATHQERCDC